MLFYVPEYTSPNMCTHTQQVGRTMQRCTTQAAQYLGDRSVKMMWSCWTRSERGSLEMYTKECFILMYVVCPSVCLSICVSVTLSYNREREDIS